MGQVEFTMSLSESFAISRVIQHLRMTDGFKTCFCFNPFNPPGRGLGKLGATLDPASLRTAFGPVRRKVKALPESAGVRRSAVHKSPFLRPHRCHDVSGMGTS